MGENPEIAATPSRAEGRTGKAVRGDVSFIFLLLFWTCNYTGIEHIKCVFFFSDVKLVKIPVSVVYTDTIFFNIKASK